MAIQWYSNLNSGESSRWKTYIILINLHTSSSKPKRWKTWKLCRVKHIVPPRENAERSEIRSTKLGNSTPTWLRKEKESYPSLQNISGSSFCLQISNPPTAYTRKIKEVLGSLSWALRRYQPKKSIKTFTGSNFQCSKLHLFPHPCGNLTHSLQLWIVGGWL